MQGSNTGFYINNGYDSFSTIHPFHLHIPNGSLFIFNVTYIYEESWDMKRLNIVEFIGNCTATICLKNFSTKQQKFFVSTLPVLDMQIQWI